MRWMRCIMEKVSLWGLTGRVVLHKCSSHDLPIFEMDVRCIRW